MHGYGATKSIMLIVFGYMYSAIFLQFATCNNNYGSIVTSASIIIRPKY